MNYIHKRHSREIAYGLYTFHNMLTSKATQINYLEKKLALQNNETDPQTDLWKSLKKDGNNFRNEGKPSLHHAMPYGVTQRTGRMVLYFNSIVETVP